MTIHTQAPPIAPMDAHSATRNVHVDVVDAAHGQPDPMAALDFVSDDAFGGIDLFVGRVRAANQGRAVTGIHYDMFDPLALNVFRRSAEAAVARFGPAAKAYVAHAKGRLKVGDVAVVVAFATPHRDAAFRGCREVIEAVKHEAPIWKQEHYVDGSSEWSEGCALCVESASEHAFEPASVSEPAAAPVAAPVIAAMPGASDCCGCGLGHAGGQP
jgi:molybdopterin synthase catalytic subunit